MPLPPLIPEPQYGGAHVNSNFWLVSQEIPPYMPTTVPVDITQGGTSAITASAALTNLGIGSAATHADTDFLQTANNLSDVNNAMTARTNLGLGSVATHPLTDVIQTANNLSDLSNTTTARSNLGLGTSSTHPSTDFLASASNLSDLNNASTARTNLGVKIGTNVEAWNANLDTYAIKTPPTGSVVGTSDTQTLSAKTLTTPVITDFTNAQHNHTSAAQGGTLSFAPADASTIANYSAGDIALGTSNDVSFSDVDATNAKLSVPVTAPGTWQVIFSFATNVSSTISLSLSSSTAFQLTDGTNTTPAINTGTTLPLSLALVTSNITPQTLIGTFVWSSAGTKTVKLQKKNITSGNIGARVVSANATSPISMIAYRISN